MLDAEQLATIDQNTDIIFRGVSDTDDSITKALALIGDLQTNYGFYSFVEPSDIADSKVFSPDLMDTQKEMDNAFSWICHHDKIMLKLDMIEDYLQKGARGAAAVFEGMNGISGATGETLLSYLAGLEKVGAAR